MLRIPETIYNACIHVSFEHLHFLSISNLNLHRFILQASKTKISETSFIFKNYGSGSRPSK